MPKRIVVCSDGTWNDPLDEEPTNVLRVARAIRPVASDGTEQVVFYDWGIGSYHSRVGGGAFGLGLEKNIQDGYRFIVQNYAPGDEIFLFGYSRGAYTVRALAGMLNKCGILERKHADQIDEAFAFYKTKSYPPSHRRSRQWRSRRCVGGSGRGPVAFVGVWDTVGSHGVPRILLGVVGERDPFYDHVPGSNIAVARHAVAFDEARADFQPALWTDRDEVDVKQVWFAGVHGDVGGGYPATSGSRLSDIPLAWMTDEAHGCGLEFEPQLLDPSSLSPTAPKHRTRTGGWKLLGKVVRQPPADAIVHRSVKDRWDAGGYESEAVEAFLSTRTWADVRIEG